MAEPILAPVPVQRIAAIPSPVSPRPEQTAVSNPAASEAVMVIARFEPKTAGGPERVVVIKDHDKPTLGFPFGGVEIGNNILGFVDKDRPHTAMREMLEEVFGKEEFYFSEQEARELGVIISERNFVGVIRKTPDHTVYVYSFVLPASSRYQLRTGKEQQAVLAVLSPKIDEYINEGIFLQAHTEGWQMYKRHLKKSH